MISEINKEKYLQLVGLMTLSAANMARLKDIESSMRALLDVSQKDEGVSGVGDPNHIADSIYSEYSPDELLGKLGIVKA